jgi:uncharacterized membrane protein
MVEAPVRTESRPLWLVREPASPGPATATLTRRPDRVVRRGLGFGGSVGAVVMFCLSLTPSLLPRHWALQGLLSGITMAIGYGIGASIGAVARAVWPRLPAAPRRARRVLAGAGATLAVVFLGLGEYWQRDLRQLVGAEPATPWGPLLVVVAAAAGFWLLLACARSVRLGTRRLATALARFGPRPVASVAAVGVVAALSYGVGQGVVFVGFVDVADRAAAAANGTTAPGVTRPSSPYVSGGPGSLVSWDTLGAYGREFTAGAVPVRELARFGGAGRHPGDAMPPIRVYIGRDSAPTLAEQAWLAVRELERTGGFDRSVLAVITTTGTGWVNPAVPDSLEYLYGGDSAIVATQYSYLPSWISFLADRSRATAAATALIEAVRERLAVRPAGERPKLVVYGESLGAHGIETAFGELEKLVAGTDGALLVGPPHTNPIWRQVTGGRDSGSPVWRPVYNGGETVGFAQDAGDLSAEGDHPRVLYLQNASDPIVWWSSELLYREPQWLDGARGPDVSAAMRWLPVVTFWQVTVDGITSTMAPPGHGHSYRDSIADAWAALAPPAGWTDADTDRLRPIIADEDR